MKTYTISETRKEYDRPHDKESIWEVHLDENDANAQVLDLNKRFPHMEFELLVDDVKILKDQIVVIPRSTQSIFPYLAPSRRIQREARRSIRNMETREDGRIIGTAQVDGYKIEVFYKKKGIVYYLDGLTISAIGTWEITNVLSTPEWDQKSKFPTQISDRSDRPGVPPKEGKDEMNICENCNLEMKETPSGAAYCPNCEPEMEELQKELGRKDHKEYWEEKAEKIPVVDRVRWGPADPFPVKVWVVFGLLKKKAGTTKTHIAIEDEEGNTPATLCGRDSSEYYGDSDLSIPKDVYCKSCLKTLSGFDWIGPPPENPTDALLEDSARLVNASRAKDGLPPIEDLGEVLIDEDGNLPTIECPACQGSGRDPDGEHYEGSASSRCPFCKGTGNNPQIPGSTSTSIDDPQVPDQKVRDEFSAEYLKKGRELYDPFGSDKKIIAWLSEEVIKARQELRVHLLTAPYGSVPGEEDAINWQSVAAEFAGELKSVRHDRDNWKIVGERAVDFVAGLLEKDFDDLLTEFRLDADEVLLGSGTTETFVLDRDQQPKLVPEKTGEEERACKYCGRIFRESAGVFYNDGQDFFCSERCGDAWSLAHL